MTVTDKFFNPIDGATVTAGEKTNHGGQVVVSGVTSNGGHTTATFIPSKFFTGSDELDFVSGITQPHLITINPGPIGGIIVDASDSVSHPALPDTEHAANFLVSVNEQIAAGKTIYVRGFLRDAYGNPINATSTSQITFTNTGVNGKTFRWEQKC